MRLKNRNIEIVDGDEIRIKGKDIMRNGKSEENIVDIKEMKID